MTHTGKIGRLPEDLQEELNRRLSANTPDAPLLQWLNSLPEVQVALLRDFDGQKITSRNLKAWKIGGYQEWVTDEMAFRDAVNRIRARQRALTQPADELTPRRQINPCANPKPSEAGQKSFSFLPGS
jgi:hypothetical protein